MGAKNYNIVIPDRRRTQSSDTLEPCLMISKNSDSFKVPGTLSIRAPEYGNRVCQQGLKKCCFLVNIIFLGGLKLKLMVVVFFCSPSLFGSELYVYIHFQEPKKNHCQTIED